MFFSIFCCIISGSFGIADGFGIIVKMQSYQAFLLGKICENKIPELPEITTYADSFGIFCNFALHKAYSQLNHVAVSLRISGSIHFF